MHCPNGHCGGSEGYRRGEQYRRRLFIRDCAQEIVARREQDGAGERKGKPDCAEFGRASTFPGECDPPENDQRGTDPESKMWAFAKSPDRDDRGENRCRPDDDRRARRTCGSNGVDEENLRDARRCYAEGNIWPEL